MLVHGGRQACRYAGSHVRRGKATQADGHAGPGQAGRRSEAKRSKEEGEAGPGGQARPGRPAGGRDKARRV
jgi:hypothetical protein